MKIRSQNRRGVTLIFVISLIVLFILLGTTFAVVTANYLKSAKRAARREVYRDPPKRTLDRVLHQLVRGTQNIDSAFIGHDLASDMYGYEGFKGTAVDAYTFPKAGNPNAGTVLTEFIAIRLYEQNPPPNARHRSRTVGGQLFIENGRHYQDPGIAPPDQLHYVMSKIVGSYNGQIFTFTDGPAKGISCRIVGYAYEPGRASDNTVVPPPVNGTGDLVTFILAVDRGDGSSASFFDPNAPSTAHPGLGLSNFVVNGRAFAGRGSGWANPGNAATAERTAQGLRVNRAAYARAFPNIEHSRYWRPNRALTNADNADGREVGLHEDYDAADFDNMHMAAEIPFDIDGNGVQSWSDLRVIPSFHRPALIAWANANGLPVEQFSLRPVPNTQGVGPEFPALDPANPWQWDVDSDGDSITDAVWVDPGFPVQTDESGRRYKILAAVLIRDLDGKLNINANGSHWHLTGAYQTHVAPANPIPLANGQSTWDLKNRGQGYGPPEISLRTIFRDTGDTSDAVDSVRPPLYGSLLYGNYGLDLVGRLGNDQISAPTSALLRSGGAKGLETLMQAKLMGYPLQMVGGAFHSHADIHGRFATGLTGTFLGPPATFRFGGMPLFDVSDASAPYLIEPANLMYQMNLNKTSTGMVGSNSTDQPFSLSELERLWRANDIDAYSLPKRLYELSTTLRDDRTSLAPGENGMTRLDRAYMARRSITTNSFHVPAMPQDVRQMLRIRLEAQLGSQFFTQVRNAFPGLTNEEILSDQVNSILRSSELIMNLPMDLNRPFGNGQDDNMNRVFDEVAIPDGVIVPFNAAPRNVIDESVVGETIWNGVTFDHDNDGIIAGDADAHLARHHFARNLYILALLALPPGSQTIDFDGDGNPNTIPFETEMSVAQWAANVVDFRDTDSIMSLIEFDLNPWDGWNVDGNVMTQEFLINAGSPDEQNIIENNRFVACGSERPELLITEMFASHDRRTEDLDNDDGIGTFTDDGMDPDPDFDQRLKPLGSFFMEIVNPWTGATLPPGEFYRLPDQSAANGVDLRAVSLVGRSSGGTTERSPIWRVLVVKTTAGMNKDPDDPLIDNLTFGPASNRLQNNTEVDRSIYFVREADLLPPPGGGGGLPQVVLPEDMPFTISVGGMPSMRTGTADHGVPFVLNDSVWASIGPIAQQQFAVVGTGALQIDGTNQYEMPFGRRDNVTNANENVGNHLNDTRRYTMIAGTSIQLHEFYGPTTTAGPLNPCMAIPVDIAKDNGSDQPGVVRSFSISEPADGYSSATPLNATSIRIKDPDDAADTDSREVIDHIYATPLDKPLDDNRADLMGADQTALEMEGTTARFREVHLQRLANPLAHWHPVTNPYKTIDSMSVDLTVFSAAGRDNAGSGTERDHGLGSTKVVLQAKQRGDSNDQMTPVDLNNGTNVESGDFWSYEQQTNLGPIAANPTVGNDGHYSHFVVENNDAPVEQETLGAINWDLHPANPKYANLLPPMTPLGFLAPPWLNWNNRLFVSKNELMQVPRHWSSRLLRNYSVRRTAMDDYNQANPVRFGHLMPFFKSNTSAMNPGCELHRILSYTTVPSRFLGTEKWFTTQHMQGLTPGADLVNFNAPFNRISNYREPGRININTIYEKRVWDGLFGRIAADRDSMGNVLPYPLTQSDPNWSYGHSGPIWSDFIDSRRGYAGVGMLAAPNPMTTPGYVMKPFRSADTSNLVPQFPPPPVPTVPAIQPDSESGFLRRNAAGTPLFEQDNKEVQRNTDRNPYFRYESLQRLGNLTTTRSNVYAVWITIGYFEVDPQTNELGKEVGSDFGEIKRHRMFSVVDRSIPFGFEPGKDVNVDKTIMLKRYIE